VLEDLEDIKKAVCNQQNRTTIYSYLGQTIHGGHGKVFIARIDVGNQCIQHSCGISVHLCTETVLLDDKITCIERTIDLPAETTFARPVRA